MIHSYVKFLFIFIIVTFFVGKVNAADVTSASVSPAINFGKVIPGNSGGTFNTISCTGTNGVQAISGSGCANGILSVSIKNNSSKNTGARIIIFFNNQPTSLTKSGGGATLPASFTISDNLPAGCNIPPNGAARVRCNNPRTNNNATHTFNIPFSGILSNISNEQSNGTYSNNYTITACRCNGQSNGCPGTIGGAQCSNVNSKAVSGSIPAQIIKPLSISESSALNFGMIISGSQSGTIDQSGAVTGGVIALSGNRSAASFNISGEIGESYTFTLPTNMALSCDSPGTCGGEPNMNVDLTFASGSQIRTINSLNDNVIINGKLYVGANQKPGTYAGTYNVTVNY